MTPAIAAVRSGKDESAWTASAAGVKGPRIIVRIELTPAAKGRLEGIAERYGMTQIASTSRLIEWFARQPEAVQAAVLGQYPEEVGAEVARLILARMAG